MGYAVYWNGNQGRHCGYGVSAICDHPDCRKKIDRGLGCICDSEEVEGCHLFFCEKHGGGYQCERCRKHQSPFKPKPETAAWMRHVLRHETWEEWRSENRDLVAKYKKELRRRGESAPRARNCQACHGNELVKSGDVWTECLHP